MNREAPAYRGGVGSRREAREQALALLYEADAKGIDPATVLDGQPVAAHDYATTIVRGVAVHRVALDERIASHAHNWTLDRMPTLDRLLLEMGTYELLHEPEVPLAAVISEMVELAGQYSTDDSGRFINGVLSAVADDTGR